MRIFITGGTGFIGRPVARRLAEHHDLLILTRSASARVPGTALVGDLAEPAGWSEGLRRFAPECCIHLAWEGLPDYSFATSRRNFDAGVELLQLLREAGCRRVVAAGSCLEYGDVQGAVAEDRPPGRQGHFAAFKSALRGVADALLAEAGIGLAWARPFFIYGPGQRPTSLIPTCLAALESGTRPAIRTPGAVNDFVHVADVAEAIALLAELPEARGPYNVGSGVPVQVGDVVNRICRLRDRPEAFPAASAGEAGMWADIGRIRSDTGWKPVVSLEEGIRDTIEAWKTDS